MLLLSDKTECAIAKKIPKLSALERNPVQQDCNLNNKGQPCDVVELEVVSPQK
eukprot:NODE_2507_length_349_cov_37.684685_g2497_i0.p2 GENE.NODE_2507_length_349_cov_37.684685_g2497_i0~~NODE_2507_length_349_cov_37.684685_g2497_i0.p2  ORF type:complete len:53 (-),score=8.09 NODE_2507_length_349_cov_37.684685_g2497_i0:120-278(-)